MKPKYKIEELTTMGGELRYRVWQINWLGFKKELIRECLGRETAEILMDELRKNEIVKKKWIDY